MAKIKRDENGKLAGNASITQFVTLWLGIGNNAKVNENILYW